MTLEEKEKLTHLAQTSGFRLKQDLISYLSEIPETENVRGNSADVKKAPPTRTDSQHRGLFLWFSMIEKEAENQGVTWDMIIAHTHQLKITKEGLHGMCKTFQEALWGTKSTKQIAKTKQLDVLIDHFTDLFGKVGLEVPPFPVNKEKQEENLASYKLSATEVKDHLAEYYEKEDVSVKF